MASLAKRKARYASDLVYREKVKGESAAYRIKVRLETIKHYGGKCKCCGESSPEFLTIDHLNGGGRAHRKKAIGYEGGSAFIQWLRKNNYPKEFRLLCYNCNSAIYHYGVCPHKR